ncbi:MAG TPA: histidinol dehydrogenase [Polyangiaceae bacterium]|nr:histidinol dehydrogenase [Polyangiaceae bacterium]
MDPLIHVTADPQQLSALLERLERRGASDLAEVEPAVREIIAAVRAGGDAAVRRFVERFEHRTVDALLIEDYGGETALELLSDPLREALVFAAARIRAYHEHMASQLRSLELRRDGIRLASRVLPLSRVGVYAPGGKASYPSSVLMTAVVASVAGVGEIVVASPDSCAEVRAACHLAGVRAILDAGGAHAIAALAYGTESIAPVDKIVGPGNIYVAAAKRLVFGDVAIDSIAGPSEILVVADDTADPRVVASDLLSQAEHDEAAYALLTCTSLEFAAAVAAELEAQLATLPRAAIATASLRRNCHALVVRDTAGLVEVANRLAAEHVAVHAADPRALAERIERAGAIFVGDVTPEAAGDYVAGPSHVLPTGGAARFSAPLGVYDFVARSSLVEYDRAALELHAEAITAIARAERLEAHARAVEVRLARR